MRAKIIYLLLAVCCAAHAESLIYPKKLHTGDTVGLISSASRAPTDQTISFAKERLEKLGLTVKMGRYIYRREGYFAGTDRERARDVNDMFGDKAVKAIFEVRGGWGSDRILPYLNYALIKKNPKIIIGFSDITALLLAIYKKTGLVTFHGPMGAEPWPQFSVDYLKQVLFSGAAVTFRNPNDEIDLNDDIIQTSDRIQTIVPGQVSGPLIGGNLTVLVTLLGTQYEPDWRGKILFIEDVGEKNYKIDRMMSQLRLAGVLGKVKGVIFGKCTRCATDTGGYGSFTIRQILAQYLKPRHIPAYMGAMIGHDPQVFTLPEGITVTMDANQGTIKMQRPGVS